jgi:hypothetical protein
MTSTRRISNPAAPGYNMQPGAPLPGAGWNPSQGFPPVASPGSMFAPAARMGPAPSGPAPAPPGDTFTGAGMTPTQIQQYRAQVPLTSQYPGSPYGGAGVRPSGFFDGAQWDNFPALSPISPPAQQVAPWQSWPIDTVPLQQAPGPRPITSQYPGSPYSGWGY